MKQLDFENVKTQAELEKITKEITDYVDTLPKHDGRPETVAIYDSIKAYLDIMKSIPTRAVSVSQSRNWMSCKRKWALERAFADMTPKDFFALGKAVHVALEVYNKTEGSLQKALLAAKAELVPQLEYNFLNLFPLVSAMVSGYVDFDAANSDYHIIMNEIDFELLLGDVDLDFVPYMSDEEKRTLVKTKGVIDFVAITTRDIMVDGVLIPTGEIIAGEYKTAKQSGNIDYETDAQASLYLMALSKLLGFPVRVIVYNTLYKKFPKEPAILKSGDVSAAAISTTQQMYGDALVRVYGSVQDAPEKCIALYNNLKAGLSGFFERTYILRTIDELVEMESRLLHIIPQINDDHANCTDSAGNYTFDHCYPNPTKDCKTMCSARDKCIAINKKQPLIANQPFTVKLVKKPDIKLINTNTDIEIGDDE